MKALLVKLYSLLLLFRKAFIIDYISYFRNKGVRIGENCRIIVHPNFWDLPDFGSEPYLVSIGNHVMISFGCTFITHDGSNWLFRDKEKYKDVIIAGPIVVGDNCFIGCKTTILPGVTIGNNCIIGANSIVTKDVPDNQVWAGNPAHYITDVDSFAERALLNNPEHERITKKNKKEVLTRLFL